MKIIFTTGDNYFALPGLFRARSQIDFQKRGDLDEKGQENQNFRLIYILTFKATYIMTLTIRDLTINSLFKS